MSHQLVGFHDYDPFDTTGEQILCLQVESMVRPPVRGDRAEVGLWNPDRSEFHAISETTAWNFPQGARQQWLRTTGEIVFNQLADGDWRAVAIDPVTGRTRSIEGSVYAVDPKSRALYGVNFARLHRLGGYGYVGIPDDTAHLPAPEADGISVTDLLTGKTSLLVSLADIAGSPGIAAVPQHADHYVTHVVPNPAGSHLAFLHRYWLSDGGIQTRLMVCQSDGSQLECRAEGFLSHFDWMDHDRLVIWGRTASALQQARNSGIMANPLVAPVIRKLKPLLRRLLKRGKSLSGNYLIVGPKGNPVGKLAPEVLTEDGHPSFDPVSRTTLLTDTYPDDSGWRTLFLMDTATHAVRQLARHQQAQVAPDASRLAAASEGIDAKVMQAFSPEHFAYSRSGVHCDFHPRWRSDAKAVCYDSNHEGRRSVYVVGVAGNE